MVFVTPEGAKTMTNVRNLSSPRAGTRVQTPAQPLEPIERQAAIENALSMALYFMRQPGNAAANVWAATARANRALTLLKQASQGTALTRATNTLGRV
jgi:hypothetical protein